ncbi:MAG: hypothetical protein FWF94_02790 [Oscillospiraceae bacterium]|nr:hypothetical protein [Oscillospiraceae bacterium]
MEWVSNWWNMLELTEQILFCFALPSSLILIIQAILIIVGGAGDGADGGGDFDGGDFDGGDFDGDGTDASGSGDFSAASMFTLQGISSFFCVFGWVSICTYRTGLPLMAAVIIAAALGFATMYAIARVMMYLMKLAQSGTLDVKKLIGSTGTVYLRIPPKGKGKGKVTVQTSERLVELDAISESEEEIPNNTDIKVIDILGENVLVVEAI